MHATQRTTAASETEAVTIDTLERHIRHARQLQAQAMADGLRSVARRVGRTMVPVKQATRARFETWAAEHSLARLSDRSLADIGLPRHAIAHAVRGQEWHDDPAGAATARRAGSLMSRFAAWRERQARRRQALRELMAYSDRDLEELGIFRSDIPRLASQSAA